MVFSYFGLGRSSPVSEPDEKKSVRALPAPWYTSREMYELERRAIFSRKWQLITHSIRLANVGDYLKYDIAGFEIVLIKDRSGNINGFHNICRHRAFPVVTEDKGNAKILSCKYHGWSYGLNGKLAKAPSYQDLPGFDKNQNGLFPIHVHLDVNGFVWINLDGKAKPEIAWDDDFSGIDTQERLSTIKFSEYKFDHEWQMDGPWNWKILADNYNECYHCPTSHPDIPAIADLEAYSVDTDRCSIIHNTASTPEQIANGLQVAPTYFWPNASMNASPNFFFIQRFVPHGPLKSTMRYEVYRREGSSDEAFELVNQMYKRIMSEDKYLCNLAQQNLNRGVFINGEMHPEKEKGPLYFQKLIREEVTAHHKREQTLKREVWPAQPPLPNNADISEKDIEFCSGLACNTNQEQLVW